MFNSNAGSCPFLASPEIHCISAVNLMIAINYKYVSELHLNTVLLFSVLSHLKPE